MFYKNPKKGAVYNIGGGRKNSCSILEAIEIIERKLCIKVKKKFIKKNRAGDHKWWITDYSKFKKDYPKWKIKMSINMIIEELIKSNLK